MVCTMGGSAPGSTEGGENCIPRAKEKQPKAQHTRPLVTFDGWKLDNGGICDVDIAEL